MSKVIATLVNLTILSRFVHLACETAVAIDKTVHAKGETLRQGLLLGYIVASGKYRAYAEATVKAGGDFSAAAVGFTLDIALSPLAKHLRVGDVITSVGGTALGTIATFNYVTGVGTLTANSANALAAGQKVRISTAVLALAGSKGKVLKDEVACNGDDAVAAAYFEGFFAKANTTITTDAVTALGGVEIEAGEVRLK